MTPEMAAYGLCPRDYGSVALTLCDCELERENDVMKLIERHIQHFFELYQVK